RPHPVSIPGVIVQPRIRERRHVGPNRAYLREVSAVISRTTLNAEAGLVAGIIRPRQIDLSRGYSISRQIARRIRHRRRRRRRITTARREAERSDSRTPVELTRRRVILRSKPESTIIGRIDRQRSIVAPTTARTGLTSRSSE